MYVIDTERCDHIFVSEYGRKWECIAVPHGDDQGHMMVRSPK